MAAAYMFDYERVAREAGIRPDDLEALCHLVRQEFPTDDMMYELHALGACLAIQDGRATLEGVLGREPAKA
jgi:hypothetical protein